MIETHKCLDCGKPTEVNCVTPLPPNEERKQGVWVTWMDENQTPHTIGVLCESCGDNHNLAWDGEWFEAWLDGLNEVKLSEHFLPEFKEWLRMIGDS